MVFPANGVRYDLKQNEHATVRPIEDSGYSVSIVELRRSRDGFSAMIGEKLSLTFDTMDQVKKYLYDYADEDHKDQFKDEKVP